MNLLLKQAIVALNYPTMTSKFIVHAKAISQAMAANPIFAASAEKVKKLNTDIIALDAVVTACSTKPPTASIEARNAAVELVQADLRSLRNDVQEMADADPANAEAIINSSAMSVKKRRSHGPQQNSAENGNGDGIVHLTAEGPGPHEWRMSSDGNQWTPLPASMTTKTTVSELASGGVYYFQNRRMLTRDEKSEWSQSVKIRVK